MQSKISVFFKPSSSISAHRSTESPLNSAADDDGALKIWEKAEHQYVNTYKRRTSSSHRYPHFSPFDYQYSSSSSSFRINYDRLTAEIRFIASVTQKFIFFMWRNVRSPEYVIPAPKNPILDDSSVNLEVASSTKTVVKNKKRSYAQYHLLFGQSDFLLHFCPTCGIKYARGDEGDEKSHKTFHKNYTCGIQFKGWSHERVINVTSDEGGRILLVLDSDPSAHRNKVEAVVKMMEKDLGSGWILHKDCQVYLFVSSQRIVGCLVVEPITKAFKVVSCFLDEKPDESKMKDSRQSSTTLQFGDITFQREAILKKPTKNPEALDKNLNGAILCEEEAVPAVCGVRAIWVTPANRRKHIASQLLDALGSRVIDKNIKPSMRFTQKLEFETSRIARFKGHQ